MIKLLAKVIVKDFEEKHAEREAIEKPVQSLKLTMCTLLCVYYGKYTTMCDAITVERNTAGSTASKDPNPLVNEKSNTTKLKR